MSKPDRRCYIPLMPMLAELSALGSLVSGASSVYNRYYKKNRGKK